MREVQLRDAKAGLSAIVDQAIRGEPAIITRRGKPAAVLIGYDEWRRLANVPSFGRLLVSLPVDTDDLFERDRAALRDVEL